MLEQQLSYAELIIMSDGLTQGLLSMLSEFGMLELTLLSQHGNFSKVDTLHGTAVVRFINTDNGLRICPDRPTCIQNVLFS
jgi:hypothetical protein